jgi:ribonuclease HI
MSVNKPACRRAWVPVLTLTLCFSVSDIALAHKGLLSLQGDPKQWVMPNGNYSGWNYSPLDEINLSNVQNLSMAWTLQLGVQDSHEASPLVIGSTMYIVTPKPNYVYAIDLAQQGTDGGCSPNPGPGGFGVVLLYGEHRRELSGGYRRTTNNRMELIAAIRGLEALKHPCSVRLFSDSQYVVNGMMKGWSRRWRSNGWRRLDKSPAENADLREQLLILCDAHDVVFQWVRGHAGNKENECCDRLAAEARFGHLLIDTGYDKRGWEQ